MRAANPPGVFDQAAIGALSQWRYKPVLRDAKPVAQRARIRIRFTVARLTASFLKRPGCARASTAAGIPGSARRSPRPDAQIIGRAEGMFAYRSLFYRSAPGSACRACCTDPWYAEWGRPRSRCRARSEIQPIFVNESLEHRRTIGVVVLERRMQTDDRHVARFEGFMNAPRLRNGASRWNWGTAPGTRSSTTTRPRSAASCSGRSVLNQVCTAPRVRGRRGR